ncbi:hypothetical protein BGW36DRAFT_422992 [Talaromyces proteolyticus]|uniref:RRM domain-containing protein n=1 Tax=Talaromyces proteolyticus TaxID=1131652 RepID=A0AAD4Q4S5_9EURO|nr:uncharacterized protein BGW36DRAFT_422992 [Talaromyces proteolyticus]KAH8703429.1 hypothetical protein BGW36DRAFT_422992 [Talaromyces proteolyticus]
MATVETNVKHRLELLERTVYALQAQHRLLEYRIQYIEDENRSVPGKTASTVAQFSIFEPVTTTMAPSSSIVTPQPTTRPKNYFSGLTSLAASEDATKGQPPGAVTGLSNKFSFLSILDEPGPLGSPTSSPSRQHRESAVDQIALCLTPCREGPSKTTRDETNTSISNGSVHQENEPNKASSGGPISVFVSSTSSKPDYFATKKPRKSGVPWDGTIEWKLIRIFTDRKDEIQAMNNYSLTVGQGALKDQYLFQYGLRYLPRPHDKNTYRTVRVEGLPDDATLDGLLAQVCYGNVYSADLLNTIGIVGYHTARIVFLHQQSALAFCKHVKSNGIFVHGFRVRATMEKTATYPMGKYISDAISHYGCTRCVSISGISDDSVDYVKRLINQTYLKYSIETLIHREDKEELIVRFHSMKSALIAHHEFKTRIRLQGCCVEYRQDPCNRVPVKTAIASGHA